MTTIICASCGADVSESMNFCGVCGAKTNAGAASVPPPDDASADNENTSPVAVITDETAEPVPEPEPEAVPEPVPVLELETLPESEPTLEAVTEPEPAAVTGLDADTVEQSPPPYSPSAVRVIGKVSLSVVFGVVLFVLISAIIALRTVRPESISRTIAKAELSWLVRELNLDAEIQSTVEASQLGYFSLDADSLGDFLMLESVREEVGVVVERYIQAIADGDFDYYISSKEIVSFLKAVSPDIRDEFGVTLTNDDYNSITENLGRSELRDYSAGRLLAKANIGRAAPFTVFSVYPMLLLGILCLIILIDIFLLHRKKLRTAFLNAGTPIAVTGFIFSVSGLLLGPISGIYRSSELYRVARLTAGLSDSILFDGLICLGVGIVLIGIYIIIKKARKNKLPKPPAENPTRAWRYIGLAANTAALVACVIVALLFWRELM